MNRTLLKVGFDLDGVILYNPARIARPWVDTVKKNFFKKKQLKFYYPKSDWEKFIWYLFHKSSIFVAPGFDNVMKLAQEKKIEAYIITSRYSFLQKDFEKWLRKIQADRYFQGCYYNKNDEQPHIFKEKMIKKLGLDLFVEDNWNIVQHLSKAYKKDQKKTKVFWIYNIFDRNTIYPHKFPSLREVMKEIYIHIHDHQS